MARRKNKRKSPLQPTGADAQPGPLQPAPQGPGDGSRAGLVDTGGSGVTPARAKAAEGDVGAGLSAPTWGPLAQKPKTAAEEFVDAIVSGDREKIKEAYAGVGISDAPAIKSAFIAMPQDQRDSMVTNVRANKDIFSPIAVTAFESFMKTAPPPTRKTSTDPVSLEGADALAAVNAMGAGGSHPTAGGRLQATPGRNPDLARVDQRLIGILSAGASHLPAGYRVTINEGYNAAGHAKNSQHHIAGSGALDVQITDPNGRVIPNRGRDTTGMYGQLARYSYGEMLATHPELKGKFTWGAAFGTTATSGVPDLMHFDLGGERGTLGPHLSQLGAIPGAGYGAAAAGAPAAPAAALAYADNADTISTDAIAARVNAHGSLRKGASGPPVHDLQSFLADQAVGDRIGAPLKIDGAFGNRTKEAVKNYQARNGMKPTGVVDGATLNQIHADMAPDHIGTEGSPELAGQVRPADTAAMARAAAARAVPHIQQADMERTRAGLSQMDSRDFAAGAATAAVTVDPVLARAFVPSGKATLTAALQHPNENFTSSDREWDPAAARIAGTLRDNARMQADVEAAKARAGKTQFIDPARADAGVTIPQSFQDWLGSRPGEPIKEHQAPEEHSLTADIERSLNVEHWLQSPTVQDSPYNSSPSFSSISDPYRPSGGGSTYEPGSGSGSSFDNFASGMSHAYQAAASGGSVFGGGGGGTGTVYSGFPSSSGNTSNVNSGFSPPSTFTTGNNGQVVGGI